jgi:hypothetical protein
MLVTDRRDPATAAWAAQFQRRLDAGLTLAAIAADMRLAQEGGGASEWTLDQISLMQDVEYNAGLEDAQGVINQLIQNPNPAKALTNAPVRR